MVPFTSSMRVPKATILLARRFLRAPLVGLEAESVHSGDLVRVWALGATSRASVTLSTRARSSIGGPHTLRPVRPRTGYCSR